jgi:hypothetical protein
MAAGAVAAAVVVSAVAQQLAVTPATASSIATRSRKNPAEASPLRSLSTTCGAGRASQRGTAPRLGEASTSSARRTSRATRGVGGIRSRRSSQRLEARGTEREGAVAAAAADDDDEDDDDEEEGLELEEEELPEGSSASSRLGTPRCLWMPSCEAVHK